jgi:hypothetical protein
MIVSVDSLLPSLPYCFLSVHNLFAYTDVQTHVHIWDYIVLTISLTFLLQNALWSFMSVNTQSLPTAVIIPGSRIMLHNLFK